MFLCSPKHRSASPAIHRAMRGGLGAALYAKGCCWRCSPTRLAAKGKTSSVFPLASPFPASALRPAAARVAMAPEGAAGRGPAAPLQSSPGGRPTAPFPTAAGRTSAPVALAAPLTRRAGALPSGSPPVITPWPPTGHRAERPAAACPAPQKRRPGKLHSPGLVTLRGHRLPRLYRAQTLAQRHSALNTHLPYIRSRLGRAYKPRKRAKICPRLP